MSIAQLINNMRIRQHEIELEARLSRFGREDAKDTEAPINDYRCTGPSTNPRCSRPIKHGEWYVASDRQGKFCVACGSPVERIGKNAIYRLRQEHTCKTRDEWMDAIMALDARLSNDGREHGCQIKAEYVAEVVAHDRANDPPELYWRFRFAEQDALAPSIPVVSAAGTWEQWRRLRGEQYRG